MTILHSHRFRAALLGAGLFASFCAAVNAGEILFQDDFKVGSGEKTLADVNQEARDHQHGTLAPAVYSSNGAKWQSKANVDPSGAGGIRLYPSASHLPLLLSPSWKLSEEPGDYSLTLQIRPRSWAGSEAPGKILIVLGAAEGTKVEGAQPDLAGAIVCEINIHQEDGVCFLNVLFDGAEAAPQAELPALSEPAQTHEVKIRWKQAAARKVESLAVEIDGSSVFNLPKAGIVPRGSAVLFGGQVGADQRIKNPFADMNISEIQYARE